MSADWVALTTIFFVVALPLLLGSFIPTCRIRLLSSAMAAVIRMVKDARALVSKFKSEHDSLVEAGKVLDRSSSEPLPVIKVQASWYLHPLLWIRGCIPTISAATISLLFREFRSQGQFKFIVPATLLSVRMMFNSCVSQALVHDNTWPSGILLQIPCYLVYW
jgi:hypothetical protein